MATEDAIVLHNVTRDLPKQGDGAEGTVRVLSNISLTVARGNLLNLVGPSGSGKSSLTRLVNRLDEATSGQIRVLGRPLDAWPVRELRRQVGMVFQETSLLGLTVRENLRLPFELVDEMPTDIESRIAEVIDNVQLEPDMLDRDASELSVGQKQRVALARALVAQPTVLLLDEPTSALDPRTAERLLDRLLSIREAMGLTLVIVTHRLSEARRMGGDLAVMIDGRLEAVGPVEELLDEPPTEAARTFLFGDEP